MAPEIRKAFDIITRREKPSILLCTPEVTELPEGMGNAARYVKAKRGGLADISAALVEQLHEHGDFDLHVALPKYDKSMKGIGKISTRETNQIKRILKDKNVHLINHPAFSETFANGGSVDVYGDTEIHDSVRKAMAYQSGVINYVLNDIQPNVVHCNDWMTGLIPAAAKSEGIKSLFTLHNIFTKYLSPKEMVREGVNSKELNGNLFYAQHPTNFEWDFHNNLVDFTTTGIFASDYFNTVSPTFLEEIVRGDFKGRVPEQMREQIRQKHNAGRATGITNAPRISESPEFALGIKRYNSENFEEKKAKNKKEFQEKRGLIPDPDIPLYVWTNRLSEQKGIEQLIPQIKHLSGKYDIQMAFIADGEKNYENALRNIALDSEGWVSYSGFDGILEKQAFAGGDFLLMPSLYEPCGLPQMTCKRYGTLPVVRNTGGLADTVKHLDLEKNTGSGFVFDVVDRTGFEYAIEESLSFYTSGPEIRNPIIKRVMEQGVKEHNLEKTAEQYLEIYDKLVREK